MSDKGCVEPFLALFEHFELSWQQAWEAVILHRGGVTADDARWALNRLDVAWNVRDEWGWLRTAMLAHAAERLHLTAQARREASQGGVAVPG
jgi:hypothetical protein